MSATFRKIRADEVMPGMRVSRSRSGTFALVTATEARAATTRILFRMGTPLMRPRHEAMLWVREEVPEHVVLTVVVDGEQDSSEVFYDDVLYRERLREVAEDAIGHGYPTEVYVAPNGAVGRDPVQTFN